MAIIAEKLAQVTHSQVGEPCRHARKVAAAQETASSKKTAPVVSWKTWRTAFHSARKKPGRWAGA
jgi:hypothetical protein